MTSLSRTQMTSRKNSWRVMALAQSSLRLTRPFLLGALRLSCTLTEHDHS